jgi:hypothetical protein
MIFRNWDVLSVSILYLKSINETETSVSGHCTLINILTFDLGVKYIDRMHPIVLIMTSLKKTIKSVVKISTYIITSITARNIGLPAILVIISVSTFITAVTLYIYRYLYYSIITWCFSYWPSYRSDVCCIGLRRSRMRIQQTEDL